MGRSSSFAKEKLKEDDTINMTNEMIRMSLELTRHGVDRSMSLDRKVIGYKTRTVSQSIYEDKLVKNMTIKICYDATNTNPNNIYIPINVCLEDIININCVST